MKIGVFGGCFNPPHKMHLTIALTLLKQKIVDNIIFVPTGSQYEKPGLASEKERWEMLTIMCRNYEQIEVSSYEFGGLKYTYQTLKYFKEKYPEAEIYFITGTDNLKEIETWKEYEYILQNFSLIVIKRNRDNIPELEKEFGKYHPHLQFIQLGNKTTNSTQIRKNIKERGTSGQLDKNVLKYIKFHQLYH